MPINGTLNPARKQNLQSTASTVEDTDDMEDVTIGMHIISNLSDAFSGAVSRASSAFSGILSNQKEDAPNTERSSRTRLKKLLKPSKFFGLEETKTGSFARNPSLSYQISYEDISTQKQELLIGLTQTIWSGAKVSLTVKNDVRALMLDERYRSYLLLKLLAETHDYAYDAESRVPDVALQDTNMFRNLVWVVRTIISGYERNWANRGVNTVGSAFMLLELAHTHFWDQKSALAQLITSSDRKSQKPSSLRGSTENLAKPDKGSLANFAGWIKSTAKEIRRSSLVGNSSPEIGTPKVHPASAEVSVMQSPLLTRGQPDKGHKLFAREVIFDEPDALKSRSSSRLRVVNGQLIQCKAPAGTASNGPQDLQRSQPARYYIFETLISSTDRSRIWDQPQFWEDAFLDAVGRERDVIGLDHSAMPMLKKYSKLSQPEKKLLELKEDRILACLLHNMIAYMVMLRLPEQEIRTVTFRLLGRCRLGAYFSNLVSNLLDNVHFLEGNSIDLLPVASKSLYKQAFIVFRGNNSKGNDAVVFEIYRRSFLLRNLSGAVDSVKFLTNFLAAILFPKARVLILLESTEEKVTMLQFYARKARTLFYAIKVAVEQNLIISKTISEPVRFCQRVLTNEAELQAKLEALGPAEGVTFSGEEMFERDV
uniref:MAP kinase-activating death domain-containing protein n=2 Tax=Schistocephalus solidus TaxID=70667 RepID=A0A0X3P5C3_SCHSO